MVWVTPSGTQGAGSLVAWEEMRRNSFFLLQRHRAAGAAASGSRVGAALSSLRRALARGASAYRIVLADHPATCVAEAEDEAAAELDWVFLDERVVPQLQMASIRFEDVLAVARGLFHAASLFDRQGPDLPLLSISTFTLKIWQITTDLIPTVSCWVPPTPARLVGKAVYSELAANEFMKLEESVLPLHHFGPLMRALGAAAPPPPLRIVVLSREQHVIARSASTDELLAANSPLPRPRPHPRR